MTTESIPFTSREAWLEHRAKDITSTDVAALFGLSPYLTEFELWHRKAGKLTVEIAENERMRWGTRLESAIAEGVAEDHGLQVEPLKCYMRVPSLKMGSSFDFKILPKEDKPAGILEIKNVDSWVFKKSWQDLGDNLIAPPHIELQVQHQLEVSGEDWAIIGVLVGGNTTKIAYRKRDLDIGLEIRRRVALFWKSVDENKPPKPDFERDAELITKHLYNKAVDGEIINASPDIDQLMVTYRTLQDQASELDMRISTIRAQVLTTIGTASKVICSHGTISTSEVKPNPGKLITPDMVGTYQGARKGFRNFRFTPKKEN